MESIPRIVLASRSPRRAELLRKMGLSFDILVPVTDEDRVLEDPGETASILSRKKALDVLPRAPGSIVIGADTVVHHNNRTLGKPADAEEARRMLASLAGRTHQVFTGFTILDGEQGGITCVEMTRVTFLPLESWEIEAYVRSGSPFDKAGAYGIQDAGHLIERIEGCFFNVMGFPLARFYRALKELLGPERVRRLLSWDTLHE